jgi:ABC-type multidrug transport system fused ATPase/permease subunit
LGIACVLWIGAQQVAQGDLTTGSLIAFLLALGLLNEPLKGLSVATGLWEEARGGLERVHEVLAKHDDPAPAAPIPQPPSSAPLEIELRKLSVRRGGALVLRDIDLRIRPGDRIVIQGASGAGKSTLLDCLAGFVPAAGGAVLWSGCPAEELSLAARRAQMALVDQDPWLGSGSVAEAIRIGRAGASPDDVRRAAEAVGLELDLDRPVGDGSSPVSGGERQRIALARALLRDAGLLLFDEPCSNLDLESERRFLELLTGVAQGRAILLVTHRPAAVAFATEVYDLVDGQLIERPGSLQALA